MQMFSKCIQKVKESFNETDKQGQAIVMTGTVALSTLKTT